METLIVGRAESETPFELQPGESKIIALSVPINNEKQSQDSSIVGHLSNIMKLENKNHYKYKIKAGAKIEGLSFEPHSNQDLQVLLIYKTLV